jgi:hypothetical protein
MRIIILLSAFFIASVSANETTRFIATGELIELTHIDNWMDLVRVINSDEEIPAYMNYKEPTIREKKVLLGINLLEYEKGLRRNLGEFITESELNSALKLYRNPFIAKTVNAVNYFEIAPIDLMITKKNMHPKLRPLIISLYNILGHQSILVEEYKKYKTSFIQKKKALSILQSTNDIVQNAKDQKIFSAEEYREIYFEFLYNRVKSLSIPELREFIRMTRSNNSFLKVNQVLTSFSYGFISAEVDKIDAKTNRKSQLGM